MCSYVSVCLLFSLSLSFSSVRHFLSWRPFSVCLLLFLSFSHCLRLPVISFHLSNILFDVVLFCFFCFDVLLVSLTLSSCFSLCPLIIPCVVLSSGQICYSLSLSLLSLSLSLSLSHVHTSWFSLSFSGSLVSSKIDKTLRSCTSVKIDIEQIFEMWHIDELNIQLIFIILFTSSFPVGKTQKFILKYSYLSIKVYSVKNTKFIVTTLSHCSCVFECANLGMKLYTCMSKLWKIHDYILIDCLYSVLRRIKDTRLHILIDCLYRLFI